MIWSGKYQRVIIKAPRGGGKSKLLGTLGYDLWFLKNRKVVNMAASFVQAQIVYNYFKAYCEMDESIESMYVDGVAKMTETKGIAGQTFSCITASTKQTRGKHPDVFISDETCETTDELIHSALPMVDSSDNPLVVMASTFHKVYGIFQETWDDAEERGYLRIQWDIFDVCKEFPADIWEQDHIKNIQGIEKLKAFAKGRIGDPDGWVSISNVIQAWKEKPTENWFEVEYLGSRPSTAGLVLKPEDIDRAIFDNDIDKRYNYIHGATTAMGIDWGFSSMTAMEVLMAHKDQVVVQLSNQTYSQISSEDIIKDAIIKIKRWGIRFVYADSAGKFENKALKNALAKENIACAVIEVVFGKEKEGMLGNFRAHFEQSKYKIPKKVWALDEDGAFTKVANVETVWQYKRYRYQEGTDKPVKKDDHIPDATMCAMQHFKMTQYNRPLKDTSTIQKKGEDNKKPVTAGLYQKTF